MAQLAVEQTRRAAEADAEAIKYKAQAFQALSEQGLQSESLCKRIQILKVLELISPDIAEGVGA